MPAVDLSAAAARERGRERVNGQQEQEKEPEIIPVDTAFLVYRRMDTGQIVMTHDVNSPIQVRRSPNHDDVYMMMQVILKDMQAAQVAELSAMRFMQAQQQLAQQMMSPAEAQAMAEMFKQRQG